MTNSFIVSPQKKKFKFNEGRDFIYIHNCIPNAAQEMLKYLLNKWMTDGLNQSWPYTIYLYREIL